jgi:uncharacterized membrane protein YesL
MAATMPTTTVTNRLAAVCDVLAWCAGLTLGWVLGALAGGILLGVAPATSAAVELVRRRERGDAVRPLRDGIAAWRRELWHSQPVLLPPMLVLAALWTNYAVLSGLGRDVAGLRITTLVAFVVAVAIFAWLPAVHAHYDLRASRYLLAAGRLAIGRPASTVLLLFVAACLAFVCVEVPGLMLVGPGAWWFASTWLCLRFFAENDARLAESAADAAAEAEDGTSRPAAPARTLPVEPLRIH